MTEDTREGIARSVARLEELLDRLPQPVAREVRERVAELRRLLLEQRPPRLVLVGRRGSGKSSLVNAVFGAPVAAVGHERATTGRVRWFAHEGELGALEVLDTRGLQEGSTPDDVDAADAETSILAELGRRAPDAVVFLVKATEADAAIDADVDALRRVVAEVRSEHGLLPPVVGVLTHCDTVEPKGAPLHAPDEADPADLEEKLARIGRLELDLKQRLRATPVVGDALVGTIGVCTYQSWRTDGTCRADERWRVEELLGWLLDEVPDEARVTLARVSRVRALQHTIADRLVNATSALAGGVAAVPLPVADLGPLTALQAQLVAMIAWLSGRGLDLRTAAEFAAAVGANVGAAFGLREVARGLAKVVFPGAGSLVSAAIAAGATHAIGRAAIAYFVDGRPQEEVARIVGQLRARRS